MKLRLTYESRMRYGRRPITDFERRAVAERRILSEEGCCDSQIASRDDPEVGWCCTRSPHKDGMHVACGMHDDIIAMWVEELIN